MELDTLKQEVNRLLDPYPDLKKDFTQFLPGAENVIFYLHFQGDSGTPSDSEHDGTEGSYQRPQTGHSEEKQEAPVAIIEEQKHSNEMQMQPVHLQKNLILIIINLKQQVRLEIQGHNDASDIEDVSQMTNLERSDKIYLEITLKSKFNGKPEVYKEIIKCMNLYILVLSIYK